MIVLSVGMPRAGSGWHYNLVHDLMRTTGCAEAAEIRRQYHLEDVLTEVNVNIGVLSLRRLLRVAIPAWRGNTFVIKAHSRPTTAFRIMRALGLIRTTYIYRDPRDAMLSAMEYGRRAIERGAPNAFSHLTDFAEGMGFILTYVRIWRDWVREPGVLVSRYEDLLEDYPAQAGKLARFLGLKPEDEAVRSVIDAYQPAQAETRQGTHFSRGRIGRFRHEFTPQEQKTLVERLGPDLARMGYLP